MRHPLEAIPVGRRRYVFLPLLALTLAVLAALGEIDKPLRTAAVPWGIISFEVAGDVARARAMIASWTGTAPLYAALSLGVDYLFMVAYSTTIALGCLWAAGVLGSGFGALARPLAWGQWVAAVLDAVENWALARMLLGDVADPWPQVAWWCAVPKFVLVYAGILYALAAAVVRLARRGARG